MGFAFVLAVTKLLVLSEVVGRLAPMSRPHRDVAIIQGRIRGYLAPHPPHFQYFGIPYARPPTRRDRFKAPKPPPQWDGIFEATHKIKCPQPHIEGEENCLVVNIFTQPGSSLQPVLVIVHDGDFQHGWGNYEPPLRFLNEGFVIVTFNYRIGALGFLCLDTTDAPGNAGLKDQVAALYWVHMNIAAFNGDPNSVTIYGLGSGAASVQLLIMSGLTKDMVHRVILESGSALSPSAITYDPISTAFEGATNVGYDGTTDTAELFQFYQDLHVGHLVSITEMFLPCIENSTYTSLLDSDPIHKLKMADFAKVPMLISFNYKDSATLVNNALEKLEKQPQNLENLLPNNLEFDDDNLRTKIGEFVKEFYFGDNMAVEDVVQGYTNYIQDIFIEYPIVKLASLYAMRDSTLVYLMKFAIDIEENSENNMFRGYGPMMEYLEKNNGEDDEMATKRLMLLLKNFIEFGDPTPLTSTLIPLIWQPVSGDSDMTPAVISAVPMLVFIRKGIKMVPPPTNQRMLFWDNIYSRFYKPLGLEYETLELYDNEY